MGVFKNGLPRLRSGRWLPRFFLHEKNEKRILWTIRGFTVLGIATSIISLPWQLRLSFLTDEDIYYVYLYPSFERNTIKQMHEELEAQNALPKYGKEHLGLIMSLVICKGFETKHGYALGVFTDNHAENAPFLLAPFLHTGGSADPEPLFDIEPIQLHSYKARIPQELTENDFEYVHWRKTIQHQASGVDA